MSHNKRRVISLSLALLATCVFPLGSVPTACSAPAPAHTPTKLALLIGIDNYKYPDRISPLAGSINDVEDMRQVLIGKFEFLPENILVLKDSQATHAGIINAIQTHLIAKAQPDDIVVFHFSGHGSQMPDVTHKKISNLDETMVPYDSRDAEGKVFDISGAELHALLLQLAAKTKNVTFILDSCHSGTIVRGPRVRWIPADTRTPPPLPAYVTTRSVADTSDASSPKFVSIAAATSRESAFEHSVNGIERGALTFFLTQQLRAAKAGATYRDIMDSVIGNVTANYPAQHPSLEGAEADEYVFGDASSVARSYVTASPSLLDVHRVTLGIGQVQGATMGSTYDVYPPYSKKFAPPEKPAAKVRIVAAGAFTSEAAFISGASIPAASRAVEREHRYGNSRVRVFLDDVEKWPALQSIRDALQSIKYIELVDRPSMCNLQVKQDGERIRTLAADSTTLSTPIAVSDPALVDRITSQIKSWAKWFNVLSIHNAHPEIELQFTLKGAQTRDPMARVGRPDMGVREGDKIDATLTNNSDRDLYIAILDLSSDGSISVVYPTEHGAKEVLRPGLKLMRTWNTSVPTGRSSVTDILKVFASYKPIDLTPLTQGRIRASEEPGSGSELDPLQELLVDSAGLTRQVSSSSAPMNLGSWTTVQRVLLVRRAN